MGQFRFIYQTAVFIFVPLLSGAWYHIMQQGLTRLVLFCFFIVIYYLLTYLLTPWSRVLLEKLFLSYSRISLHFMEPEDSLPHSQMPSTCPYPEPAWSSPYPHIPISSSI